MVYFLRRGFESKGGSAFWSETTEPRKPLKGVKRFYATDNDCYPLGSFPERLLLDIASHWILLGHEDEVIPRTFNYISASHFSGLQVLDGSVADVFSRHYEGFCEVIQLSKVWSTTLGRKVEAPYFLVNVFKKVETIDLDASGATKVINPTFGMKDYVDPNPKRLRVCESFMGETGVWRNSNTSDWFCDDAFREDVEKVTPGT